MKKIVFAGGCFWGVQKLMDKLKGVKFTKTGYANGNTEEPKYREVVTGETGYAEAVYVEYDKNETNLDNILKIFWQAINPTTVDKQGFDEGNQYRTGIYYYDDEDKEILEKSKEELQKNYNQPVVTEIEKLKNFYDAEEYHQKYLNKNPGGYCHIKFDKLNI